MNHVEEIRCVNSFEDQQEQASEAQRTYDAAPPESPRLEIPLTDTKLRALEAGAYTPSERTW